MYCVRAVYKSTEQISAVSLYDYLVAFPSASVS